MKYGFYYSPDIDITRRRGTQSSSVEENPAIDPIENEDNECKIQDEDPCDSFWWNMRLYENFKYYDISESPWKSTCKLIRGYVGYESLGFGNICVISRKATLMGGIIDTGIDDDGSVASFVETEVIVEVKDLMLSFVMTRGSVPCFWDRAEDKLSDLSQPYAIEINREFEMHEAAFEIHIRKLVNSYSKVVLVNLLDTRDQYEQALLKFYEFLLKKYKDKLKR